MTGRKPARRRKGGGKGLLLVVALVLIAGLIRYADTPRVTSAREKAAEVLAGAPGVDKVLAVIGGGDAADEVFSAQQRRIHPMPRLPAGRTTSSAGKKHCSRIRWMKPFTPWNLSMSCPPKAH